MKLLYCRHCGDLFSLRLVERECECGQSRGSYNPDRATAWTRGPCEAVAIGNGSLHDALAKMRAAPPDRAFYPIMAWVRPDSGPGNPRTTHKE